MGVSEQWAVTDVFGLEPDLLAMLPQPIIAILMLFPVTEKVPPIMEYTHVDDDGSTRNTAWRKKHDC